MLPVGLLPRDLSHHFLDSEGLKTAASPGARPSRAVRERDINRTAAGPASTTPSPVRTTLVPRETQKVFPNTMTHDSRNPADATPCRYVVRLHEVRPLEIGAT